MLGRGLRIGRVFGIPIEVNITWFFIFLLVAWTFAQGNVPLLREAGVEPNTTLSWGLGFLAAFLLFASILLHELSHSYVAVRMGIPVGRVTLFMFGGVAQLKREPDSPGAEFCVAVAGPLMSAAISAAAYGLHQLLPTSLAPLRAVLYHLFFINAAVLVFNLVPAFPLDGGRILRSILWALTRSFRKATLVAATLGRAFGIFLVITGVAMPLMNYGLISGLWMIFIGFFLYQAAEAGYVSALYPHILRPRALRDFLEPGNASLSPDQPASSLSERASRFTHSDSFPVIENGELAGIASVRNLASIPPDRWGEITVGEIMEKNPPVCTLSTEANVLDALNQVLHHPGCYYVLTEGGRVHRVLSVHDIAELVRRLRDAGVLPHQA